MVISLNKEQAKGLSNFFFDVAKGISLGGLGFLSVTDLLSRFLFILAITAIAYTCIVVALTLLKGFE